jgi:hypothetical protein
MIYNENLYRLTEVAIVEVFMLEQDFKVAPSDSDFGLILYNLPYVIEFKDALIENYLELYFSDIKSGLMFAEGATWACCVDIGLQDRLELKNRSYESHPQNQLFLSEGAQKMYGLHVALEAIDKLLPLIKAKGGLASMCDGTFDSRFDFKDSVKPMWHGMKERYLRCIAAAESDK